MNIAYIIPSLVPMGPVNVAFDLVTIMLQNNHQCIVYYFDDKGELTFPCTTEKINFKQKINFNQFDIVHTHGLRPNLYILYHKPLKSKTKYISTFHNYVFQDFKMKYGTMKSVIGGSIFLISAIRHNTLITLSKDAMKYYGKWYPQKKLTFIYNSRIINDSLRLSDNEKKEIQDFKKDSTLIGMNGSLLNRKGVDLMIQTMTLLPETYKLFIVGDGKDKNIYKKLSFELKLDNRIYFAGSKENAYRYLPYYDIFAMPSRSEGFPLALLEAAAAGKKTVCSDLPIIKETFNDSEVSMFHLPDIQSLAQAILTIDKKKNLGDNLRKRFNESYSPTCLYINHMNIYSPKEPLK